MARAGSIDEAKHEGNLYWLVQRTSEESAANMTYESATWEHQIKLSLPAPKRRKIHKVEWGTSELPSFPLLVNKAPVEKHIRLQVFQPAKKGSPGGVSLKDPEPSNEGPGSGEPGRDVD